MIFYPVGVSKFLSLFHERGLTVIVQRVKKIMKNLIVLLLLFCSWSAVASDTLSSKITRATVFLSGAQVFRETKTLTIKKGVNEIILSDVSPYLDQNQIQATAKGSFLILDVQYQSQYVAPPAVKPSIVPEKIQLEMDALNDSILFVSFEKDRITAKLKNLEEERRMVMQNQLVKSGGISDTLPEFREIVEFYRAKLDDIDELVHLWKKRQFYVTRRESTHRNRLNELSTYANNTNQPSQPARTRHHIVVTTYADVTTSGKIEASYLINNAGWIPAYDLRADNTVDPMTITYKANVYQNSGEDWKNVNLVLSTYDRNSSIVKPVAGVWRLDYTVNKRPVGLVRQQEQQYYSQNFASEEEAQAYMKDAKKNSPGTIKESNMTFVPYQNPSAISQNFTNVEFDVKLPYSIKADGSQKLMVVMHEEIDAKFYHYMLPRSNQYAFLQAKIGDWEDLSLLPGKANIYFNHTTVGSIMLNPSNMQDTLELTLGKDRSITAKRRKIAEEERKTALGKRTLRTMTFELEIRNNSRGSIDLTLEDLIPITGNEDIEIKITEGNGAQVSEGTGLLTWKRKIKAGQKEIIQFTYTVEHEKDNPVS